MKTISWEEFLESGYPGGGKGYAASVGAFDGVHLGHLRLLRTLEERSSRGCGASAVITFRDNPKRILRPAEYPGDISSLRQRLARIEAAGIELCVLIDYDVRFGEMTGEAFLELLRKRTGLACLVMGQNARLGSNASMDARGAVDFAKAMGVDALSLPSLVLEGIAVSSSRIRLAVRDGDFAEAARLLGYPFELDLDGWVKRPKGSGLELDAPRKRQILPASGSFGIQWREEGGDWRNGGLSMLGEGSGMVLHGADGLPSRIRFV